MAGMNAGPFDQAKAEFLQGLACHQAGELPAAERHYRASLALLPGRPSTLVNLAAVLLQQHQPQQALEQADAALAAEPGSTDALLHRGHALAQLGLPEQALAALGQLLALDPTHAATWGSRADLLREQGRRHEAAQAYRQALQHGGDARHRFALAALEGGTAVPPAPPPGYVQALFDSYAEGFNQHLLSNLHYQGHHRTVALLPTTRPLGAVLDLGCGTGLAAPLLRPRTARLVGLDLSGAMLQQARTLGLYDELVQADAAEWLAQTPQRFDAVVAADVFIYIGAVGPVWAGVRRVLKPGGLLALSVEAGTGTGLELRPSLRYAHPEAYLREQAAAHGFGVALCEAGALRQDQAQNVAGLYLLLSAGPHLAPLQAFEPGSEVQREQPAQEQQRVPPRPMR